MQSSRVFLAGEDLDVAVVHGHGQCDDEGALRLLKENDAYPGRG